jgi:fatty acid synthase
MIQVCSTLARKAIKMLEINDIKYLNENKTVAEEILNNYLKDIREEHVIIQIFDKILNTCLSLDQNKNLDKGMRDKNFNELVINFKNATEYDLSRDVLNQVSKNERFIRPLLDIVSENNTLKKDIKVLEINLSNAIMALEADNHLACAQIYTITVDYTIANNSIENLDKDLKNKGFKLIEWDNKQSIFPSGISTMDLIIYRDCQDLWDIKIDDFLKEVYDKIADKGFFISVFRYKLTEPELILNHLYKNNLIKDSILGQRIDDFRNAAEKIGFKLISRKCDSIGSLAFLFRKTIPKDSNREKKIEVLEINENYEKWLDVLKEKVKENIEKKDIHNENINIWLIANDSTINGITGLTNCLRQEPGGDRIRCIFDYDKQMKFPPDFSSKPFSDILINDLAINVIRDGKLGTYRHLRIPKNHDKIESNDYYLNVGPNGDLSSLQWFDSKNIAFNESFINLDNRKMPQMRCNVYSAGLNFRDVMFASGIHY